jgi:23S rRNA pseudouridine955/2504/2580 synthase
MARKYVATAQVCHRLDKETSGALVLAKDAEAYRSMSMQLESRKVQKIYHAICDGLHEFREQEVNMPIRQHPKGGVLIDKMQGKVSITIFNTLRAFRHHTLVECRPLTGRMHQVRIHLSVLGAPISGDLIYGGKPFMLSMLKKGYKLKKFEEERPLISHLALHACRIRFLSLDHKPVTAEAPYSKDFSVLLTQLEKNL